ncbi:MAG: hemolysin III family protein [Mariprofundaceae bacterium]|nr:hemolysin III family protein [Mariprofundaceae bacterium]
MDKWEKLNSLTHLIGAIAALAGMVVLVVLASQQGDAWKIVSFSIYGVCLFLLYFFSTLYHGLSGNKKLIFQKLDHIAIYLLIAGTYMPFALVTLRGTWGWVIFGVVWGLALLGISLDLFAKKKRRIIPIMIYLIMGWIGLTAIRPLMDALSVDGFLWLLSGGLFYTVGIIFYVLGKKKPCYHTVWHLFVLAGSLIHYITIFLYVL